MTALRVALVTTPPAVRSGIGDYTRHLLPWLRRHCEVTAFTRDDWADGGHRPAAELDPRQHDRVLFQLGNERQHAFMLPLLRRTGGVVVLHDWVLFDLACAAFPELAAGGWRGHWRALAEGGPECAQIYALLRSERRAARRAAAPPEDGPFLAGWHAPEAGGRWTSARALLRLQDPGLRRVRLQAHGVRGRRLRLSACGAAGAGIARRLSGGEFELEFEPHGAALLELETAPVAPTEEQKERGDGRELGTFVRAIEVEGARGRRELDLTLPSAPDAALPELARERFRLPLNGSVLRLADAFLVHSAYVLERVRGARPRAPAARLHHGAERRWEGLERAEARAALAIAPQDLLVASLGGLQPHKRVAVLVEGFALAHRLRPTLRLALVGGHDPHELDVRALARAHGLESALLLPGWVEEHEAQQWLAAADLCVNLRGPSTGGSSGGLFQALSCGRAVIGSDLDEQRELPSGCVLRIAAGAGEAAALAEQIVRLHDQPQALRAMEWAAREFVERECHWSHVATAYAAALERFPRARQS